MRIVNIDGKLAVKYWEMPNEANMGVLNYDGAKQAAVFNAAAIAMEAVDPTIKTGGPAVARVDLLPTSFVDQTIDNLDFLSFHPVRIRLV